MRNVNQKLTENRRSLNWLLAPVALLMFAACAEQKPEPSGKASTLAAKSRGANANSQEDGGGKPKLDKVIGQIAESFKGITFYDGVYNVGLKLGFIQCGGEFPIRFVIPNPDEGITSPLDFMGSKIQCFGIQLPLDDIIKGLMPMLENAEMPESDEPLLGLANEGGFIGLTKLGPISLSPPYPILPDILSSGPDVLKTLNKSSTIKLSSDAGSTESGTAAIRVTQFDSPYQPPGGKVFNKTMIWQISNSGFQKTMLGPHLLSNLQVALSMDPLAVPNIAFDLAVMQAGSGAFQTILETEENPPFFLKLLVDSMKLLKGFPFLADLKFEFKADLIRFLDGGEEMKLRQQLR